MKNNLSKSCGEKTSRRAITIKPVIAGRTWHLKINFNGSYQSVKRRRQHLKRRQTLRRRRARNASSLASARRALCARSARLFALYAFTHDASADARAAPLRLFFASWRTYAARQGKQQHQQADGVRWRAGHGARGGTVDAKAPGLWTGRLCRRDLATGRASCFGAHHMEKLKLKLFDVYGAFGDIVTCTRARARQRRIRMLAAPRRGHLRAAQHHRLSVSDNRSRLSPPSSLFSARRIALLYQASRCHGLFCLWQAFCSAETQAGWSSVRYIVICLPLLLHARYWPHVPLHRGTVALEKQNPVRSFASVDRVISAKKQRRQSAAAE